MENNEYIDEIIIYSPENIRKLKHEKFDDVINFEKLPEIYEFLRCLDGGRHLGLALKKRIVALFCPIAPHEIYFYNRGSFLLPRVSRKCRLCFKADCGKKKPCMEYIFPAEVKEKIDDEFKKYQCA